MKRAWQSAEPWVNQNQSNMASSSQCWTDVGASRCLKTQRHILVLFNQCDEWKVKTRLTVVEPAILKAVEGVEQRHVEEANHLSDGINGKKTNNHTLKDHKVDTVHITRNVQRCVGVIGESAFTQ